MHITGECQCDSIRYEFNGEPVQQVACHCTECQHQSGSAFKMTLVVNAVDFCINNGDVKLHRSTSTTGREKLGAFRPECGNRIYHQPKWRPGRISIKPGTLDHTSWLKPQVHLWTCSKQSWVILPDGAQVYETHPES